MRFLPAYVRISKANASTLKFEELHPKESWDKKLRRLMTYFEEDTQLRDILITGGDALMSQNENLAQHIGRRLPYGGAQA